MKEPLPPSQTSVGLGSCPDRCQFLGTALTGIAFADATILLAGQGATAAVADETIRSFRIAISEEQSFDIRERLMPEHETVADATQGARLETIQQLVQHHPLLADQHRDLLGASLLFRGLGAAHSAQRRVVRGVSTASAIDVSTCLVGASLPPSRTE